MTVQLWASGKLGSDDLVQCGGMQMEGKFLRGNWSGQTEIGEQSYRFKGSKQSGVIESAAYKEIPFRIEVGWLKASKLILQIEGENWEANFPKTLMMEGERPRDKYVRFSNKEQEFKFCIFPAESYGNGRYTDGRVLLPRTSTILNEIPDEILKSNPELIKLFIALGLLGFAFYS
ncbi:MAG: hypothetical protein JWQ71_321 [Pedosphaera sp.]|nr:hypothetical protein [Pedosphaera sp.]